MIGTTLTSVMRPPDCLAMATADAMAGCEISTSARSTGTTIERNMGSPSGSGDRSAKLLSEEPDGPAPGEIGCTLVEARTGVVVERVVGTIIHEELIGLAILLHG